MTCYSDHNEDIRTKGSCDLCGGTEPDGPRVGVVSSSELGDNWSASHHLDRLDRRERGEEAADELEAELGPTVRRLARDVALRQLPGDRPDEIGESGVYGWRVVDPMTWERHGPVVQVVEATNGRQWIATPARHYATQIALGIEGLAIDQGMGWFLPTEDVRPFVAFARRVAAEAGLPPAGWEPCGLGRDV
jgi:hypothetical protein